IAFEPFAWIVFTAAPFSWVIVPHVQAPSVWKSMSNTPGATAEPPVNGTLVMFTLIPPVDVNRHAPDLFLAACSWYCQRALAAGLQQAPVCVLQATGAGQPAVAQLAAAGCAISTTGTTMDTTNATIVATDDARRMGTSPSSLPGTDTAVS